MHIVLKFVLCTNFPRNSLPFLAIVFSVPFISFLLTFCLTSLHFHVFIHRYVHAVVIQSYESEADNEYVIRGNSVVMKCEIPSYVADFVFVDLWLDSENRNYYPGTDEETGIAKTFIKCKTKNFSLVPMCFLYILSHFSTNSIFYLPFSLLWLFCFVFI